MADRPRVLIEDWLPMAELGIESRREAAPIPGQFPKLKTLHVWWARRPLAAAAGAVLGSVMPAWTEQLAETHADATELHSEKDYQAWFLRLCGILGDAVAAKRAQEAAVEAGVRIPNPYTYKPAFKNCPTPQDLELLRRLLSSTWGDVPSVFDPTAGGGSIPFEAVRYGLPTIANDLNPVAVAILDSGVSAPARYGPELAAALRTWGKLLVGRVSGRLSTFFPSGAGEQVATFLFARTVACPRTGKPVPLAPNWWLARDKGGVAVRLVTERKGVELELCEFEIASGAAIDFDPDRGTLSRGDAISPWDGLAIESDHVKAEAMAGRMGSQLFAVVARVGNKRQFRLPTVVDLVALDAAEAELKRLTPAWLEGGIIPTEDIPPLHPKQNIKQYGILRWSQMFSPRQLLVHGTFVEEYHRLIPEVQERLDPEQARAVLSLLGLMVGKGTNFNSYLTSWHAPRQTMRSVFDRHDFALKWTYAEFEGARELYPWCLEQIVDAYQGIANLLHPHGGGLIASETSNPGSVSVTLGTAGAVPHVPSKSQVLVCIDPPYYDNVMYAELADFFYVWEKRTVGAVHPDWFTEDLCDKKNEAVANLARFADTGSRRNQLANADYEAKMTAIFAECHRVMRDDGVLTVMFTHKRAEAWDTLGMGLMEVGFTIESSWPVNTESEQSLHQAGKNAAASTIFLVCRKRDSVVDDHHPFFEDIEADVRAAARDALASFSGLGIAGVDLLLSTYGPALSVISSRWPVYSSEADPLTGRSRLLRPEEALDAARAEVVRLQRQRLVGRQTQLDPLTDFALIAWDTFRAAEFPFDEARRLALAVGGLDVDELVRAKILEKRAGTVVLVPPAKRVRRRSEADGALAGIHLDATTFPVTLDAVHAVMHLADSDGLTAAKALIDRGGLGTDDRFLAALQGLVNAIPRTKVKGVWVRPEAGTLDDLCTAYFPDITLPADAGVVEPPAELFPDA
jgi:adenine-specific DNA methylase